MTSTNRGSDSSVRGGDRYSPLEANQQAIHMLQSCEAYARASADRTEIRENRRLEIETARHDIEKDAISRRLDLDTRKVKVEEDMVTVRKMKEEREKRRDEREEKREQREEEREKREAQRAEREAAAREAFFKTQESMMNLVNTMIHKFKN